MGVGVKHSLLTAVLLVAVVGAVAAVVALERLVHALGAVVAAELVELAGNAAAGAVLLVAPVAAVHVAVAALLLGQAQPRVTRAADRAPEVVGLALPVRCGQGNSQVTSVSREGGGFHQVPRGWSFA